jgi:four helix bundle protein
MPTYERFEDLPVWKAAQNSTTAPTIFSRLLHRASRVPSAINSNAPSLSISNNIAEGFERGTTNELLAFIYISRGSAGEVRSMLTVLCRRPWIAENLKSKISDLKSCSESCSRQLRAWAGSLQDSGIAGQRHLNTATRAKFENARDCKKSRV